MDELNTPRHEDNQGDEPKDNEQRLPIPPVQRSAWYAQPQQPVPPTQPTQPLQQRQWPQQPQQPPRPAVPQPFAAVHQPQSTPQPQSISHLQETPGSQGTPEPQSAPAGWQPLQQKRRRKERSKPSWFALFVALVVAALIGGGLGIAGVEYLHPTGLRPAASAPAVDSHSGTTKTVDTVGSSADWQAVAKEVGGAVVSLDVETTDGRAQGSGVIIDDKGRILTNNHVVEGAKKLYVMFADGRLFEGQVMGTDEATDLAVVEMKDPPKDLTVAQLGDSATVQVGEEIAAIGNPMGLDSTLTTGVVSALDRPTQAGDRANVVTNAIQIDAAINPGNSGGPVFDAHGKVIGIASSIITVKTGFSGQGGSIGLGFAIPINLAKNISQQLIDNGSAEHAYLGVTVTNGYAQYDDTHRVAAKIESVEPGTPAEKAGIKPHDKIVSVDDRSVPTATALTGFIRQYRSGDVVKIKLERDGKLLEVDVTLATREDPRP